MESWFPCPAVCLFVLSVPVADHTGQNLPVHFRSYPDSDILRGWIPAVFSYTSCHRAEWHFSVSGIPALPDGSCQLPVQVLISALSTYDNRAEPKARKFVRFPDRYAEHQANKTVSVQVERTPVSSMIKQDGNIFKLCPRFGTIVSSMQRNTGYVRRKSGTSRKAMDAVIFMNRE